MVRSLWYKFMINVGINQASAGTVVRLGREKGIPVPVSQTLFSLIRAIELAG